MYLLPHLQACAFLQDKFLLLSQKVSLSKRERKKDTNSQVDEVVSAVVRILLVFIASLF